MKDLMIKVRLLNSVRYKKDPNTFRYPSYLKHQFDIDDPRPLHWELINEGYLAKDDKGYSITEKGLQFLEDNKEYLELAKEPTFMGNKYFGRRSLEDNLAEYEEVKASLPFEASHNDVLWGVYNKRQLEYLEAGNLDKLKSNFLDMFRLLNKEGRPAVQYLLYVIYMELSDLPRMVRIMGKEYDPILPRWKEYIRLHPEAVSLCDNCTWVPVPEPIPLSAFKDYIQLVINEEI